MKSMAIKVIGVLLCSFSLMCFPVGAENIKIRGSIWGDLQNLDPAVISSIQDKVAAMHVFQPLVDFDVTAEAPFPVVPVLAKSWKISKDGKTVTFKLHQGVQFHKGYGEFTSEDVVFTMGRHFDKKVGSRGKSEVADVERIEAPDKYTVVFHLKHPSGLALISNLASLNTGFILSKKAVQELGDKIATMPIGTGPYTFERWNPGENVILKKFDKYWGDPPKIDEIELLIIPEEIVALGLLEKGDLDLTAISQQGSYQRAKTIKNIYLAEAKGGNYQYIYYINQKKKPMDDVRVRRALAYALDIKGICKRIGPLVIPFPSPLAPGVFGATDKFWKYDYDLDKAKKLLAEAGYPNGFKLKLIYNKYALHEPIALEVKNCWSKIVDVDFQMGEPSTYYKKLKTFEHHVAAWGFARFTPFLYAERYLTNAPRNYCQYSNPKVDEIAKKAQYSLSEEESLQYWLEFQKIVTEDVVTIIPAVGKSIHAISKKLKGVVIQPYVGMYYLGKAYVVD